MRYFTLVRDCTDRPDDPDLPDTISLRITSEPVTESDDEEVLESGTDFRKVMEDIWVSIPFGQIVMEKRIFAAIIVGIMGQPDFNALAASAHSELEEVSVAVIKQYIENQKMK
ncbi:MAG: hypothetical protein Q4F72_10565 [Desulfovibrionaceae bacterium]|nr:hypothetical protein [Desulfovibrionaceae bacterium]